ncbi:MAG: hypothetical protein IPO63_09785 [Bacteroidetes bacterium]|nr:hypothetical protein [Bacteroidota bacterium]
MRKILLTITTILLSVIFVNAQPETEPNNNINQSNPFTAPVIVTAHITTSSPDDRDFFKITLPSCASWTFNLIDSSGNPGVLQMRLYNLQNTSNGLILTKILISVLGYLTL